MKKIRRIRQYELQNIFLEGTIISSPVETRRSSIVCELQFCISSLDYQNLYENEERILTGYTQQDTTIYWHPLGIPEFKEGDYIRVYATVKNLTNSGIDHPRRMDVLSNGKAYRHFC